MGRYIVLAIAIGATPVDSAAQNRASASPQPMSVAFDLGSVRSGGHRHIPKRPKRETARPALKPVAGDAGGFRAPSIEMNVGEKGPVLAAGAFGSKRKGVPKLAHVVFDWDF